MTKSTLLELTQDVLEALSSDAVNSINDTLEATQVAKIVVRTYKLLSDEKNWPHQKNTFALEGLSDISKPTHLRIPVGIKELEIFNYNKRKSTDTRDKYSAVEYLEPDIFLRKQNGLDSSDAKVTTVIVSADVKTFVRNDLAPTFWTSFDDDLVVTNNFDKAVDTTLQQSKTQCWGYTNSTDLILDDTSVPDLPEEMFSLLLHESISTASVEVKQVAHPKAEQAAVRQRDQQAVKSWRAKSDFKLPDLGYKR